jgi:hypothetical protein
MLKKAVKFGRQAFLLVQGALASRKQLTGGTNE